MCNLCTSGLPYWVIHDEKTVSNSMLFEVTDSLWTATHSL